MTRPTKKTDEELRSAVASSESVTEALRKLGRTPHGGVHKHFTNRIAQLGVSTDHFFHTDGRRKKSMRKRSPEDVLTLRKPEDGRQSTEKLRRSILFLGVEHRCSLCGQNDRWNDEPLVLQIDHISGDWWDDRIENLRFLCPNCHTQTMTRKKKRTLAFRREVQPRLCFTCSKRIYHASITGYCTNCLQRSGAKAKIEWPEVDEILRMLEASNFRQVGKELGVSDNAVKKYLKRRGIVNPMTTATNRGKHSRVTQ